MLHYNTFHKEPKVAVLISKCILSGSEEGATIMGDVPPQYSNLEEMAMKVQTSSEKKAGKTTKKGGRSLQRNLKRSALMPFY